MGFCQKLPEGGTSLNFMRVTQIFRIFNWLKTISLVLTIFIILAKNKEVGGIKFLGWTVKILSLNVHCKYGIPPLCNLTEHKFVNQSFLYFHISRLQSYNCASWRASHFHVRQSSIPVHCCILSPIYDSNTLDL